MNSGLGRHRLGLLLCTDRTGAIQGKLNHPRQIGIFARHAQPRIAAGTGKFGDVLGGEFNDPGKQSCFRFDHGAGRAIMRGVRNAIVHQELMAQDTPEPGLGWQFLSVHSHQASSTDRRAQYIRVIEANKYLHRVQILSCGSPARD